MNKKYPLMNMGQNYSKLCEFIISLMRFFIFWLPLLHPISRCRKLLGVVDYKIMKFWCLDMYCQWCCDITPSYFLFYIFCFDLNSCSLGLYVWKNNIVFSDTFSATFCIRISPTIGELLVHLWFKVAPEFETTVSIFNEFTDFSLYNLLYDKEYYIGI